MGGIKSFVVILEGDSLTSNGRIFRLVLFKFDLINWCHGDSRIRFASDNRVSLSGIKKTLPATYHGTCSRVSI